MEIKNNFIIYKTVEDYYQGKIIYKRLDNFISTLKRHKNFIRQGDITDFFGIVNTTYFREDKDFPSVNSHCKEKTNLIKELLDLDIIKPKSSTTYYVNLESSYLKKQDLTVEDNIKQLFYYISKKPRYLNNLDLKQQELFKMLRDTCVCTYSFISWHTNKFFPEATVDKLNELGFEKFYEINKENIQKKREYFSTN